MLSRDHLLTDTLYFANNGIDYNLLIFKGGSINYHRQKFCNYGLTFYHLSVSLWRILPVFSVTMPASLHPNLTLCSQR